MSNHMLITICVLAGALASCGSDGNGGGLTGACAELLKACNTCADDLNKAACLDVAEDEIEDDCAALLLLDPCDIL